MRKLLVAAPKWPIHTLIIRDFQNSSNKADSLLPGTKKKSPAEARLFPSDLLSAYVEECLPYFRRTAFFVAVKSPAVNL